MPGGDDGIPDPIKSPKWRYLPTSKLWVNTDTHRKFPAKDYDLRANEIEQDFKDNVVAAKPRDLPPEPEFWKALTSLRTTPSALCRLAKQSQFLGGFYLNVFLSHAKEFCQSKQDVRYPRAGLRKRSRMRPTSEDKRADYFARAMAGLSLRKVLSPATTVDLLRKLKHGKGCPCWQCRLAVK